jgi:hypothetical protein
VRDADHHDPTVDAETADDRFDGGRRRRGDEDDARAAEALQRLGRVLGPGVDGVVRTELGSQLALVGAPGERDGLEPRRTCVLDAEVSQPADPLNRDEVTGAGAAVPRRVERRDASVERGRGVDGVETLGDRRERLHGNRGVLRVAAVERHSRDLAVLTLEELSVTTGVAGETVSAVPAVRRRQLHAVRPETCGRCVDVR